MSLLNSLIQTGPPTVSNYCVRHCVKNNTCQACFDICPTNAITIDKQKVSICADKCIYCGHCLFVCPTQAIENISSPVRYYDKQALVPPLSLITPSVEELLIWHHQFNIRSVQVEKKQYAQWEITIAKLNILLRKLNQPAWTISEPITQPINLVRRHFLRINVPQSSGSSSSARVPFGRQVLRALYPQVSWYQIHIEPDKCSLCSACSRICKEDALVQKENQLFINSQQCTNCGNCVAVCIKKALSITIAIKPVETFHVSFNQQQCESCQQTFYTRLPDQKQCHICNNRTFKIR